MGYIYRDGTALAAMARWALAANGLVAAAALILTAAMDPWVLIWGDLARPFALLQLVTELGSLILFLTWFYRANANARAMGADGLMGSPGLSVAWFFIPIAFLFMPFVVVRDTWKASAMPRDWQGQPAPPLVGFWFVAMVSASIASFISFRLWIEGGFSTMDEQVVADLFANGLGIVAATLGIALVTRIQALQSNGARLGERFR